MVGFAVVVAFVSVTFCVRVADMVPAVDAAASRPVVCLTAPSVETVACVETAVVADISAMAAVLSAAVEEVVLSPWPEEFPQLENPNNIQAAKQNAIDLTGRLL